MTTYTQQTTSSVVNPVLALVLLSLVATLIPAQAEAKSCRKVYLEVKNRTGGSIKMLDLDYWDTESEKWRSEPVKNEVIKNNRSWQETRKLEHVHNQQVKLRVEYKKAKWNKFLKRWGWTKKQRYISRPKKCTKRANYVVTLR